MLSNVDAYRNPETSIDGDIVIACLKKNKHNAYMQFLYNVSHNLRTNNMSIRSMDMVFQNILGPGQTFGDEERRRFLSLYVFYGT